MDVLDAPASHYRNRKGPCNVSIISEACSGQNLLEKQSAVFLLSGQFSAQMNAVVGFQLCKS